MLWETAFDFSFMLLLVFTVHLSLLAFLSVLREKHPLPFFVGDGVVYWLCAAVFMFSTCSLGPTKTSGAHREWAVLRELIFPPSVSLGTFLRLSGLQLSLLCLFCLLSSHFTWSGPPSIRPKSGWNSLSPVAIFRRQAK